MPTLVDKYDPDLLREAKKFENYFVNQVGNGGYTLHYSGADQDGDGWLSGLWQSIKPLLWAGGKALAGQIVRSAGDVISDVSQGASLKDSARIRAGEAAHFLGEKLQDKVSRMAGSGKKRKSPFSDDLEEFLPPSKAPRLESDKIASLAGNLFSLTPPPQRSGRDLRVKKPTRSALSSRARNNRVSKRGRVKSSKSLLF